MENQIFNFICFFLSVYMCIKKKFIDRIDVTTVRINFSDSRVRLLESLRNWIKFRFLPFSSLLFSIAILTTIIDLSFKACQFHHNVCSIKSERGLCRRHSVRVFSSFNRLSNYRRRFVPPPRLLGLRLYGFSF